MSDRMTENEAVSALTEAVQADGLDSSDQQALREAAASVAAENAGEQVETSTQVVDEGTTDSTEEDSFTGINPNDLPTEMRPYYDSMLADYRRKTQAVAESARQYEALEQYGGADNAVQALDWIASLSNPENAKALYDDLKDALVEQGYSLEEAAAAASSGVAQAQEEESGFESNETDPRFDSLQQKVTQMEAEIQEQKQREREAAHQAALDRQEAQIIRDHPEYTDEDVDALYSLAYATDADLNKANIEYQKIQSHLLSRYIEQKGKAPSVTDLPATGSADQAETIKDLNDPALDKMVNRLIAEMQADQ